MKALTNHRIPKWKAIQIWIFVLSYWYQDLHFGGGGQNIIHGLWERGRHIWLQFHLLLSRRISIHFLWSAVDILLVKRFWK